MEKRHAAYSLSKGELISRLKPLYNGHGRNQAAIIDFRLHELFDSLSNLFKTFKPPLSLPCLKCGISEVLYGGCKVFAFENDLEFVILYDVEKNKWTEKLFEATESISYPAFFENT